MAKLGDVCSKATSNIAQKDLDGRHGEYPIYSIVNKDTVQDSLDGIMELQTLLVEISDKAAKEKEKKKN